MTKSPNFFFTVVRMDKKDATCKKTQWKQMWIRKEPDEDGYFLLQLARETKNSTKMFLTAEDASSLIIARK